MCLEEMTRAGNVLQPTRASIHPCSLNIRAIIIFSERGSERYFLQLATFTVIMIHPYVHMSVFLCSENRMFCIPSLTLITHGTIRHRHPEMAQLHDILEKKSLAAKPSGDGEINGNSVIRGLLQDFLKIKNELSILLRAQGWKKYTHWLVTTSGDTVGRISVPGTKHWPRGHCSTLRMFP